MARIADPAGLPLPPGSTIAQMIGAEVRPQLRPVQTSQTPGISHKVAQGDLDNGRVSAARLDAERGEAVGQYGG